MASLTSRLAGWAAGRLKGEKAREKTMEFVDKTGVGKLLGLAGDAALLGGAGKLAGMGARAIGAKLGMGAAGAGLSQTGGTQRLPFDTANAQRQNLLPKDLIDVNPVSTAREQAIRGATERINQNIQMRGVMGGPPGITGADISGRIGTMGEDVMRRAQQAPTFSGRGIGDMVQQNARDYIGRNPTMMERAGSAIRGAGSMIGGAGRYLRDRPEVIGQALTAGATARTAAANRQLERERMAQQESQFAREYGQSEEQRTREIERQRRIAELLAPIFQRIAGGQG